MKEGKQRKRDRHQGHEGDGIRAKKRMRAEDDVNGDKIGPLDSTWNWDTMLRFMRQRMSVPVKVSLEDFPVDLALLLIQMVNFGDRIRLSKLNRHWNSIFMENADALRPRVPSLLLPSTAQTLIHDIVEKTTYAIRLPQDIRQHARVCGSSDGGWFVLAMENPLQNILFNVNDGTRFELPTTVVRHGQVQVVRLLAAVFNRSPSEDGNYLVGAILSRAGRKYMASCGHHSAHWLNVHCPRNNDGRLDITDLVYHGDAFCFLTGDQNLRLLRPGQENLHAAVRVHGEWMNFKHYPVQEISRRRHYLLKEGLQLFRIVKFEAPESTHSFFLFMLQHRQPNNRRVWTLQPKGLEGRTVFLGTASSRVVQMPNAEPRIMFYDDRGLHAPHFPNHFYRTDSGNYYFVDKAVHPWPPAGGEVITPTSDRTPPGWWIH